MGNVLAFFELPTQEPDMDRDNNTPQWVQHIAFEIEDYDALLAAKDHVESQGIDIVGPDQSRDIPVDLLLRPERSSSRARREHSDPGANRRAETRCSRYARRVESNEEGPRGMPHGCMNWNSPEAWNNNNETRFVKRWPRRSPCRRIKGPVPATRSLTRSRIRCRRHSITGRPAHRHCRKSQIAWKQRIPGIPSTPGRVRGAPAACVPVGRRLCLRQSRRTCAQGARVPRCPRASGRIPSCTRVARIRSSVRASRFLLRTKTGASTSRPK